MYAELFFALQYVLNFTFVLTKPPDGQWGALQSDGTWTGAIRELQDEKADIGKRLFYKRFWRKMFEIHFSAIAPFGVSIARSKVVTFSETIEMSPGSALFVKNPLGTFNFKAYFDPLTFMSWIFVGLFCILTPISIFATSRFGHGQYEFTWVKSQIFVLSALTIRGWPMSPNQLSSRCAFIV